jgi:protein MAK11
VHKPASTFNIPSVAEEIGADQHIQIVTGSYDRALHGVIASWKPLHGKNSDSEHARATFHDNFLFNAHGSAIRCLATSPSATSSEQSAVPKVLLATGGTDERVNLYQLDASAPSKDLLLLGALKKSLENPKNREVGALLHHSSSINALHFATKSKLLSAAGDNTIAVTRTRDWTVLSSIKAPVPQPVGRPSGDTAGPGETPAGINDFAIHPSHKLMISTGRGERCMRLWNLVTGKKAGVLNFERDLLQAVGEGRWARGEGLKVQWNTTGDEFAIAFERGVAVFAMVGCYHMNQGVKAHMRVGLESQRSHPSNPPY